MKSTAKNVYPLIDHDKKFYKNWRKWLVNFLNANISKLSQKEFLEIFQEFVEKFYDGVVEPHEVPSLCVDTEKNRVSLTFAQQKVKGLIYWFCDLQKESLRTGQPQKFPLPEPLAAFLVRPRLISYDPNGKKELGYGVIKKRRYDSIVFDKDSISIQPVLKAFEPRPLPEDDEDLLRDVAATIRDSDWLVKAVQLKEEVYKALSPEVVAQEGIAAEFKHLYPDRSLSYHVGRLSRLHRDLSANKGEASPNGHMPPGVIAKEAEEKAFKNLINDLPGFFVPFETWYDEDINSTLRCTIAPLLSHIPLTTIGRCPRCLKYFQCTRKKETPFCPKCQNHINVYKWRKEHPEDYRGIGKSWVKGEGSLPVAKRRAMREQKKKQDS